MAEVVLTRVSKSYPGGVHAVKDNSLRIADREFAVLVGPSGCGKSTTLRMIAGLEEVTSGTITIDGKVVNNVPPRDRDIAMVFQNYALYPHMDVRENLAFGLKLRGLPKTEIEARVDEAATMLGLKALLDRKPKALSGGQRQRVALGRAIVRKPKVFLFDEPLSNLDAQLRHQMRGEIARLHHRLQTTMIYVTHDQVEAMTMGTKIVVMKEGEIQQVDTPLGVYDRPVNLFVAGFIGSPTMNFCRGVIRDDLFESGRLCLLVPQELASRYNERQVVLGIRPEHLQPATDELEPYEGMLAGEVELIEPMGAESHVHIRDGAHVFIARVRPDLTWPLGKTVKFWFAVSCVHFFDPVSGQAIGPRTMEHRATTQEAAERGRQQPVSEPGA